MAKDYNVTIAGKEYRLIFRLTDAAEIEAHASEPSRRLSQMMNGTFTEKCSIVWGGLKHADKKLTPKQIPAMFQAHIDAGGEWERDVWLPCVRAMIESQMIGSFNQREVDRIMDEMGESEEGKV